MGVTIQKMRLEDLNVSDVSIRECDISHLDFQGLKQSIKNRIECGLPGLISPVKVREEQDKVDPTKTNIVLIDGLQRYTAHKELGIEEIDVINDGPITILEALTQQFQANKHRIAEKPAAEGRQFARMLMEDPRMTAGDLATMGGLSTDYVTKRLNIDKKAVPQVKELIDDGSIILQCARELVKLTPEDQILYLEDAISMTYQEFAEKVVGILREQQAEFRKGRGPKVEAKYIATPKARKINDVKAELADKSVALAMYPSTPELQEAFTTGIAWVLEMDSATTAQKKEKFDARVIEKTRLKKERKAAAAEKASVKAAAVAAKAQEEWANES